MQNGIPSRGIENWAGPIGIAVLVHAVLWTFGPALISGNLHSDTLEAAYWGRDLALGYSKHPPLTTWLIDFALRLGVYPIASLMLASQVTVAVAAVFVWKSVRLYASQQTAALAVAIFILSPAASFYAVQINHNSVLAPFYAATLYFGLIYLELGRWRDAIGLGIAVGLGVITKYEIAFAVAPLLVLAVVVPRFRETFSRPASYVSVLIFLAILAPHVWWLNENNWPSLSRALGSEKITDINAFNISLVNALVGALALLAVPTAVLLGTRRKRAEDDEIIRPDRERIAFVLLFVPIVGLLLSSIATWQVLKPLWVLPLTTSTAIGLALLFPAGAFGVGLSEKAIARFTIIVSGLVLVAFALYLMIAAAINRPLTAYSAETKALSEATERLWAKHSKSPLKCVVTVERKLGPSVVLWMRSRPDIVDFSSPSWGTPAHVEACAKTGGIALLVDADATALKAFPNVCVDPDAQIQVRTVFNVGKMQWPVAMAYIPPAGSPSCATSAP